MTAESHDLLSVRTPEQIVKSLQADRTPRNIRACLPPADREYFDRDYRRAMAKATEELDLAPVNALLAHWWHMARMKATGEYEAVLERGARIQEQIERGEYVPGRPLREVLAERASVLGVELDL
ncbi:hypothetical protein SAMN05421833_129124 [Microbispora rosea]|uniref:Uncharacterized protein n=1 Tax=Microbispora rosea TaxID=58117 RepID=A0A1N7GK08_9ACTN|nr:DUF6247 family protein [Microbispora rosea]GIH52957.1 hypothetical protein Mro03_81360 [Microbispora rosea subsp. rosea]SIS12846.1 hypothetical protein SAMN05421833_129124 [Microbispora rosea]